MTSEALDFGLICESSEDVATDRSENRRFDYLTHFSHLTPSSRPANSSEYPHKLLSQSSHWSTFLTQIVWVYLHSNFHGGLRNTRVQYE